MDNSKALFDWYTKSTSEPSEIMTDQGIEVLPPDCDHPAILKAKTEYLNLKEGKQHKSFIVMVPVLFTGIFE